MKKYLYLKKKKKWRRLLSKKKRKEKGGHYLKIFRIFYIKMEGELVRAIFILPIVSSFTCLNTKKSFFFKKVILKCWASHMNYTQLALCLYKKKKKLVLSSILLKLGHSLLQIANWCVNLIRRIYMCVCVLRGFRKLIITSKNVKNISNLIK